MNIVELLPFFVYCSQRKWVSVNSQRHFLDTPFNLNNKGLYDKQPGAFNLKVAITPSTEWGSQEMLPLSVRYFRINSFFPLESDTFEVTT